MFAGGWIEAAIWVHMRRNASISREVSRKRYGEINGNCLKSADAVAGLGDLCHRAGL